MAGIVRSDLLSENKIDYNLLTKILFTNKEQDLQEIIADALDSVNNGNAIL